LKLAEFSITLTMTCLSVDRLPHLGEMGLHLVTPFAVNRHDTTAGAPRCSSLHLVVALSFPAIFDLIPALSFASTVIDLVLY